MFIKNLVINRKKMAEWCCSDAPWFLEKEHPDSYLERQIKNW